VGDQSGDLIYLGRDPLNAEVRPERITGLITPAGQHYVRDHFPIPDAPDHIEVTGLVGTPGRVTLAELRAMPARRLTVTLECAGNGRAFLEPHAPGEQWHLGAVGTAEWAGVPLRDVLERAGPRRDAVEVLFAGADRGTPGALGREIAFERSLPIADALSDGPLLAHEMNGAPLPREHGAPLRLVMPGWYGMASVKWLARIELIGRPFDGFFQKDRYVIDGRPLRTIAPRAIITAPADGARLPRGPFVISGRAWTGRTGIELVNVSSDGGFSWHPAALDEPVSPYAWRRWSITMDPGERSELAVLAYAETAEGEPQPTHQVWNALGYANNAALPVRVFIG
jgi:DMSO/TMAO reductase YedYZ molybdopterin-dependent catalytic subunit